MPRGTWDKFGLVRTYPKTTTSKHLYHKRYTCSGIDLRQPKFNIFGHQFHFEVQHGTVFFGSRDDWPHGTDVQGIQCSFLWWWGLRVFILIFYLQRDRRQVRCHHLVVRSWKRGRTIKLRSGGETGIRTLGARKGTTVFETAPFDRSGTSPTMITVNRNSGNFNSFAGLTIYDLGE